MGGEARHDHDLRSSRALGLLLWTAFGAALAPGHAYDTVIRWGSVFQYAVTGWPPYCLEWFGEGYLGLGVPSADST